MKPKISTVKRHYLERAVPWISEVGIIVDPLAPTVVDTVAEPMVIEVTVLRIRGQGGLLS